MIEVKQIKELTPEVYSTFEKLIPQLSASAKIPAKEELCEIIKSDYGIVLAATDSDDPGGTILGCMTLVVFRIPTGLRAWVEDVVVDSAARGKGVGESLIRTALERAKTEGVKTVDLTSRPSREAANRLYRRCGFIARETNIYRFAFEED